MENSHSELCVIPKKAFQDCFQKWQRRWESCINTRGEYFEGDKVTQLQACPKRNIKKIVPKLSEQTSIGPHIYHFSISIVFFRTPD
jgi:hypothetical protein